MALQLRFVSHSETGLVRKNNQDSGYASPNLLVVADGMGGAAAGDLASAVAIHTIRDLDGPVRDGQMLDRLSQVIHAANDRIAELIAADHNLDGMGTTVTGALFDGEQFGLAHIGDSRAYLLRNGRLERLTHDHSWVQSLVDDGKITEAEAAVHPHRSLLLKVLNGQPANDPDLTMLPVRPGDRLLFCSDGVCGLLDDDQIEAALRVPGLQQALDRLVADALAQGGIDNITAIVADVTEAEGSGVTATLGAAAERTISNSDDTVVTTNDGSQTRPGAPPAVVPPDRQSAGREDEARYDPRAPRRRHVARPLVGLLVVVLVVAVAAGAGFAWIRTQFFVGANSGQVAIFRGLPQGLPGVPLSSVYEVQPLAVKALPPYYAEQVMAGIEVSSLDAARQTVRELTAAAQRCAQPPLRTPTPRPTATASASPAASPRATTSAGVSQPPGTSPSPARPSATPTSGADC